MKSYRVEYKSRKTGKWQTLNRCSSLQTAKSYARAYGESSETRIWTLKDESPVRISYFDGKDFHSEVVG